MIHALSAVLALWLVDPEVAPGLTPSERFEQGRALYDRGRYSEAAEIFVRLHAETGEASVLHAAGQSFRLAGKCQDALAAYEAFVSAADDTHPRAERAPPASDEPGVPSDLDLARARVIEMRVCANRSRTLLVREEAAHLTSISPTAALAILDKEWKQTSDPTLLPELLRLLQQAGACDLAAIRLDAAIAALRPIEALADAAAPSSHVTAARVTLNDLQRIKKDERCVPMTVKNREKVPLRTMPAFDPRQSDGGGTPGVRWSTWAMGGAAVLIVAGGISGALMYRTQSQLDEYGREHRPWDTRGAQLLQDGHDYQLGAIVLMTTGVAIGATALVYRIFVAANETSHRQTASRSAVLRSIGSF
jgi:hypothetical protein